MDDDKFIILNDIFNGPKLNKVASGDFSDKYITHKLGWRDSLATFTSGKIAGGNLPTWAVFRNGIYQYKFVLNDEIFLSFHVDHDYAPGTDVYFHIHFATSGVSVNSVKWQVEYTIAKGHNQQAFPATSTFTLEQAANATPYQHQIVEQTSSPLSNTLFEVDALMLCKIKRITNGGSDNADDVFGLYADLHYQSDREVTLNKAPNFYS